MIRDRIQSIATRIITRHGGAAALVRQGPPTGPVFDPTPGEIIAYPVTILETGYDEQYKPATLVQAMDRVGMIAASADITPALSDLLRVEGVDYALMELTPITPAPDGIAIAFGFVARR